MTEALTFDKMLEKRNLINVKGKGRLSNDGSRLAKSNSVNAENPRTGGTCVDNAEADGVPLPLVDSRHVGRISRHPAPASHRRLS